MKIAIMQPYFFPYIGYFQLINAVDKFIIYDDVKYTKKGWINRNRVILNNKISYITLPLEKGSDFSTIRERKISDTFFKKEKQKIVARVRHNYRKSPYFNEVLELLENVLNYNSNNLFDFIYNSICKINKYLNIETEIIISSSVNRNLSLKKSGMVIDICKKLNTAEYINPIGGTELYSKKVFMNNGISLNFIKTNEIEYIQLNNYFIPNLSILDILMNCSKEKINHLLKEYILI